MLLGLSTYFTPWVLILWLYLFVPISVWHLIRRGDTYQILACNLAYVVGIELLCRIAKTSPYIPYEFAKYYYLLILLYYFISRPIKKMSPGLWIVLLCLPAILFIPKDQFRVYFINSFAGIFITGLVGFAFHKKYVSIKFLKLLVPIILYGLTAVLVSIIVRTPDLSDVEFSLLANFDTTGDFGSNQVSTAMGLGAFLVGLSLLVNFFVLKPLILNVGLLIAFVVRGLLTFSRGGILGGVISLMTVYFLTRKGTHMRNKPNFFGFILITIVLFGAFSYVNDLTNNTLLDRFKGETPATKKGIREVTLETITSRRSTIIFAEWEIFLNNPVFGVGPGVGYEAREDLLGVKIASHTEVSRLLSEQGLLGLIIAFIFLFFPIRKVMNSPNAFDKAVSIGFFTFAIFTSFHAAMRTTVTPFLWGLACAHFYPSRSQLRLINFPLKTEAAY